MSFQLHPDLRRDGILLGRFSLCLVLLINDSNYPWFVLVPQREDINDLIDLTEQDYQGFCNESRILSLHLRDAFGGEKLNVAALGNVTPQLHVHHIVRRANDAAWPAPIWGKVPLLPYDESAIELIKSQIQMAALPGFVA